MISCNLSPSFPFLPSFLLLIRLIDHSDVCILIQNLYDVDKCQWLLSMKKKIKNLWFVLASYIYIYPADTLKEKLAGTTTANGSTTQERWKRRRLSSCVSKETNMGDLLFKVLERNNSMLNTQLEAQNINCQLDREQKKEHSDNLIAAMNKLTDALLRIANKL